MNIDVISNGYSYYIERDKQMWFASWWWKKGKKWNITYEVILLKSLYRNLLKLLDPTLIVEVQRVEKTSKRHHSDESSKTWLLQTNTKQTKKHFFKKIKGGKWLKDLMSLNEWLIWFFIPKYVKQLAVENINTD